MRFLRRSFVRFQANPVAPNAIAVIMAATISVVWVGALLMWGFDRNNYPSYGTAVWFTLQTVTTVGYGDTTPTSGIGRSVAGVVMLTGIVLITVVTAAVTSMFIESARARLAKSQAQAAAHEPNPFGRLEESLKEIAQRLERLESAREADDDGPSLK